MDAERRRQLLLVIALQSALCADGHTDPDEAWHWAAGQGLVTPAIGIPKDISEITITPRGREYVSAWSERQLDVWLEDTFGA